MRTLRIALIATLAVFALVTAGCGSDDEESADDTTTLTETTDTDTTTDTGGSALKGTVGPGFDISVDQTSVTPGSYELEVEDLSDIHNFHLTGSGVDVTTDVAGEGTESFTIELEAGSYTFVCDPHAGQMSGTIEVSG